MLPVWPLPCLYICCIKQYQMPHELTVAATTNDPDSVG